MPANGRSQPKGAANKSSRKPFRSISQVLDTPVTPDLLAGLPAPVQQSNLMMGPKLVQVESRTVDPNLVNAAMSSMIDTAKILVTAENQNLLTLFHGLASQLPMKLQISTALGRQALRSELSSAAKAIVEGTGKQFDLVLCDPEIVKQDGQLVPSIHSNFSVPVALFSSTPEAVHTHLVDDWLRGPGNGDVDPMELAALILKWSAKSHGRPEPELSASRPQNVLPGPPHGQLLGSQPQPLQHPGMPLQGGQQPPPLQHGMPPGAAALGQQPHGPGWHEASSSASLPAASYSTAQGGSPQGMPWPQGQSNPHGGSGQQQLPFPQPWSPPGSAPGSQQQQQWSPRPQSSQWQMPMMHSAPASPHLQTPGSHPPASPMAAAGAAPATYSAPTSPHMHPLLQPPPSSVSTPGNIPSASAAPASLHLQPPGVQAPAQSSAAAGAGQSSAFQPLVSSMMQEVNMLRAQLANAKATMQQAAKPQSFPDSPWELAAEDLQKISTPEGQELASSLKEEMHSLKKQKDEKEREAERRRAEAEERRRQEEEAAAAKKKKDEEAERRRKEEEWARKEEELRKKAEKEAAERRRREEDSRRSRLTREQRRLNAFYLTSHALRDLQD